MLGDFGGEVKEAKLCPELDSERRWYHSMMGHLNKSSLPGGRTRARQELSLVRKRQPLAGRRGCLGDLVLWTMLLYCSDMITDGSCFSFDSHPGSTVALSDADVLRN